MLLPAVLAAGAAMTCDSPTGPVHHQVSLAIRPKISFAINSFAGLYVDQARIIAVHGSDSISQTFAFSADSTQLKAGFAVPVTDTATYLVTVQLLASGTLMFTGQVPVLVVAGQISPPPVQVIELAYVGPGLNIDSIRIAPRDTGVATGGQLQFRIGAWDSSGAPVSQFYIHWADSGTAGQINAAGLFKAGSTKTAVWVYANTPTGVRDSTQVFIGAQPGVPASLTKVAGDAQSAVAGAAVAIPPSVKVADALGNPVSGVAVTFAVASGGGSVTGGSATTNALGIAAVGSWTLGATAGVNTLTASASGLTAVTFTATGTGLSAAIQLTVPGSLVGVGGQGLALVKLTPAAPSGGVTVSVTSDSTQYLTVASPGTIAFAAGDTLKSIALTGVAAGVSILHASATGYASASTPVGVTPNVIALIPPASLGIGQRAPLAIQLLPAPASGLVVTLTSTDTTKVKLVAGTVSFAAAQSSAVDTVVGVAPGIAGITAAATGYADGATAVSVAGAARTLTLVSGNNQTAPADSQLSLPVVVRVSDSLGTGVSGVSVTFAVATGGGSLGTTGATTDATGQASTTWRLGSLAGTQTLTVTSTGLTGSPLTVSATATTGIASTTVTPKLDTITAINGTFTLVAQAKDASGNNVTGSFTWTSRNTAVATVSALGVVTGLTNGSTWVLATEVGGTKDSAQIVVQQKLASINVTPANRNLYLGTTFNYTAQAVDGLGTPLPTQPTFTWSTSAPAVATVDSTGKVSAIGLGGAQIKATSGTITGIGNLSVLTAITRIAVAVDSAGSTKNDTATLVSLGVTRRYHAYAYDTLNALMPGVTAFTWASSNPSVAGVPNQTSDTATATSAANGVTLIKATAQGFTANPGADLTVSQVLASIQLSPASANIGVGGTVALTARGLDANGRYISGGTFRYTSAYPSLATVDSVTGIVTGVTTGTDTVYATSASLTSNPAVVVISATVPKAISFGRDTVSVGRGSQASIPILLSTPVPVGGPSLTILLGVSPNAYAHWSTTSVTIPVGGTSVNATLVGDSAGTTSVTATDSTGLGYATGTAVAKVTANMALASGSYYVNATDVATTQVVLSDPSPAGGTYVTYSYGTAGVAAVSPDPAYIPAGQLAADIQIRALAAGATTITPVAAGVNGVASTFTAYAPVLTLSNTYQLLGLGQYNPSQYVYLPTNTLTGLTVGLTSSDTTKATVTPSVSVPVNSNYVYFTISAAGLGRAAISASATGWTAANTDSVVVTTPMLGLSGGGQIYTTAGTQYVYAYAEDSTGTSHYRTNSLLVSLRSSDTTVMKVIDTTFTIGAGAYYNSARVTPGALGGTAWIVATASGHTPDSVQYTVLGPPLAFSWSGTRYIGAGEQDPTSVYVYVPNNATSPIVVRLTGTDSSVAGVPDSVIIPSGTNYAYFPVQGLKAGTDTFTATATGYQTATGPSYTVTTPAIILNTTSLTFNNYNGGTNIYIYAADTLRGTHYRITPDTVSILVRDTTIARVDSSTAIIAAGQYYNGNRHVTPVGVGSTWIVFNAVGQKVLDSLQVTVNTPVIRFSFGSSYLGRRQHFNSAGNGFYVYTPDTRLVNVPATIAQANSKVDSVSTLTPVIDSATNVAYLDAFGAGNGTDTLTVSASGYASGPPAIITVTTPRINTNGIPGSATTTNLSPFTVYVYAEDSVNNAHYTNDTVTVHAVSSDTTVLKPDSAYSHIPKNAYYAQTTFHVYGPGTAYLVYSDSANSGYLPDTTNTMTVTGPSLTFNTSSTVLGMRQTTGSGAIYVQTQNNVTAPQTVFLKSTDTTVVTVPDSVVIPVGYSYVYFPIVARDTLGTIQVQATATGFGTGAMTVQVTRPKFAISTAGTLNTTSGRSTIYVYAEDANGNTHYPTDTVIVHLQSSAPSVANIDSAAVTLLPGQYYSNAATWGPNPNQATPGTAQLSATDSTAALYAYQQATYNVSVVTPTLNLSWGTEVLGIGQYNNNYVSTPNNAVNPIAVGLAYTGTARTTTTIAGVTVDTVTIPAGTYIVYFHVVGTSVGTDTLTASASNPPFNPATAYTAVSQGHVDPISGWPSTLSLSTGDSVLVTMYARDSTQNTHYVQDSTTFTLAPNANIEFVSGGANSVAITSIVIPKDSYYVQFYVKGVAQGTGTATISATNYVTYNTPSITVGP